MKIRDFFVSSFGIFSGDGASLSKGLTVFEGENESGKTTLMNFFRRVLFPRERYTRNRGNAYEPVKGGKQGGHVRIRMESGDEYLLLLDGAKNFISAPNGSETAEMPMNFLSINRDIYESVFAMGLPDMQSLAPLNSSDVAARFFAAGAGLGSASLPKLMTSLEARQNELYRPGNARSVSAVNQLLASLNDVDGRIRAIWEQNGAWSEKKQTLRDMERTLEEKKAALAALKERLGTLDLMEKGRAAWGALTEIRRKLGELSDLHPFPEDGIARLERLDENRQRLAKQVARVEEELNARESQLRELEGDPLMVCLESSEVIESLEQESERFRSSLEQRALLEKDGTTGERLFLKNLSDLCSWWTEEHLVNADASSSAEAYARRVAEEKDALERRRSEGEKSLAQWNRLRDDRRSEDAQLKKEMGSVEAQAGRATERWSGISSLKSLFDDLQDGEAKLNVLEEDGKKLEAEREAALREEPAAPGTLVGLVATVLLAVGGGAAYQAYLTSDRAWIFGAGALFFSSILAFSAHRDQKRKHEAGRELWQARVADIDAREADRASLVGDQSAALDALREQGAEIASRIGVPFPESDEEMDALVAEGEMDNVAHERFTVLGERSRQMASVLARMDSEGDDMERDLAATMKRYDSLQEGWRQWLAGRKYDQQLEPRDMPGYIARVLQLRSERGAVEARRRETEGLDGYIAEVRGRITGLTNCFAAMGSDVPGEPDESTIHALFAALRRAQEKQGAVEALRKEIRSIRSLVDEQRAEMGDADARCEELLAHAGANGEEGFRSLAAQWNERKNLQTEEFQERKVLLGLFGNEEALDRAAGELSSRSAPEISAENEQKRAEISALEAETEALADGKSRLALEVEQISADERLSELLFERKETEQRLDDALGDWLSVFLTRHFLEASKAKHERERQPEVIRRAGLYLSLMTNDRYTLLSEGAEQGLSVVLEEKDPSRARKDELKWSAGLGDQVYLSMRLALATLWGRNSEPLPLILDDLLVRFDEGRQRGAAEAIVEAAKDNQILLFTCQKRTMEVFRQVQADRGPSYADAFSFYSIQDGTFHPVA
ncbi:MAG TPA: hypothetical protein DIC53_04710 [Synergistaceae bacterium]|nr:hypothetical protein [Synergistaceae bacterium]